MGNIALIVVAGVAWYMAGWLKPASWSTLLLALFLAGCVSSLLLAPFALKTLNENRRMESKTQ